MSPLTALSLPPAAHVRQRVTKIALAEHGVRGKAELKLIDAVIERLDVVASLSPDSISVPAQKGGESIVPEVLILQMEARKEPPVGLLTALHRALAYPLLMITTWPEAPGPRLSWMARHNGFVVPGTLDLEGGAADKAFLESLALSSLPRTGLAALYDGLVERCEALLCARASGLPFRLPATAEEAEARHAAWERFVIAQVQWQSLKRQARAEKRLAQSVALGEQARKAKQVMEELAKALG